MNLRVVLVIPTMDRGGAEQQVALLAAGLVERDISVHVVLLTRGGPRLTTLKECQVPYTLIGKRGKFDPTAFSRLKRVLRELQPTVVHTFLFAANSYGRYAAMRIGVPVIIGSERCVDLWKTWRHLLVDRYLARCSDAMTTNSAGVVDYYASRGIARDLFHVIPNGLPPRATALKTREQVAMQFGLHPDRKWIGAVGRLWPQKRYRDLIWAADMLNNLRGDDTTLFIVGDGPQRAELLRFRDSVSNPRRVQFGGTREDVSDLLPHLQAFWVASGYEGQSNALMEAMQAAVPCVVTDIPGNRDLVIHDVTGILVKLGDAADFARQTQHLWEHPEMALEIARAGHERIQSSFTVPAMVESHLALYQRLLDMKTVDKSGKNYGW